MGEDRELRREAGGKYCAGRGPDCLAEAITRLEAAGYPVVFHIHDEIVVDSAQDNHALLEMETLMSIVPDWAPGLPAQC